jgi:hypothetical protein
MIPRPTAERKLSMLSGGNVAELPAIALTLLISLASPCLRFRASISSVVRVDPPGLLTSSSAQHSVHRSAAR